MTKTAGERKVMKAAEYHDNHDVRVVGIPVPRIGQGEVLVKTKVCGICGSDLVHWYHKTKGSPFFGHEVSGIVTQVGEGVERFKEGDRVFVHHHVPCFICHYCRRGSYTMCSTYRSTHLDPAGLAEYIRVPQLNVKNGGLIRLPDNVSFEEGSLIEPIACCMRGLRKTNLCTGDTVLIIGAGFAGLVHLQLARMMGAGLVGITDFFDSKLRKAKVLGVDFTINPGRESVKEKLYAVNEGRGADVVVITPGSTRAIEQGLELLDRGSTLYLYGFTSPQEYISILPYSIFFAETNLVASYSASPLETNAVCRLMKEGKMTLRELITHRFSLDQIGEAVEIAAKAEESLKVIITFD